MRYKCLVFSLLLILLAACGGNDKTDEQASPTPPDLTQLAQTATVTPIAGVSSPTPLPTISGAQPSPTRLQFVTSAPPPTLQAGVATQSSNVTTAIGITSPAANSTLRGYATILGSASHPNFVQYALEYGPNPNSSNLWYPITSVPITRTVVNNALGAWNTLAVNDGNYQIRLHVWLRNGVEDFRVVSGLVVQNKNAPPPKTNSNPLLSAIGAISLTKGNYTTIALGMTDPDNDPMTYLAQVNNPNIATVTPSGSAAITINALNIGSTNISITISDGRGGTASTSFTVTVTAPPNTNNPPGISPIPSQTVTAGQTLNVSVVAADPDAGDSVKLTTSTSSNTVATPTISGNILSIKGNAVGSASIAVIATDTKGLSSNISFLVNVINPNPSNQPPTLATPSNQTATVGGTTDVALVVTDPNNDPLTLTATSNNNGIASAVIIGTAVRLNGVAAGTATITVKADDNKGGTATTSFNVTVSASQQNQPPNIQNVNPQTVNVGQSITVNVSLSDPNNDPVTLSASVAPAGVATVSASSNNLTIAGVAQGSTTVTMTATDGKGGTTSSSFSVTVGPAANQPPTIQNITAQTCTKGATPNVTISTADPNGDTVTVTPTSSDGNVATISFVNATTLKLTCVNPGTATITVNIADGKGGTASTTFGVTVNAPANQSPTIQSVLGQTCLTGAALPVSITTVDPDGDPLTVSGTSNAPAVTVGSANATTINLTCVSAGPATITVNVSDGKGGTASTTFGVTVNAPANQSPTITGIGPQSCNVNDLPNITIVTADLDGDPVTVNASSSDTSVATVTGANATTVSLSCVGGGTAMITVTVDDGKGGTNNTTFGVSVTAPVANNPPTIDPVGSQTCNETDAPQITLTYNDLDGDPLTVNATSDNTASVDVTSFDPNSKILQLTCIAQGSANISVTVDDGKGGFNGIAFAVTVNTNAPPLFDVTVYSELPNIGSLGGTLNGVYSTGQGFGNPTTSFSVAGDETAGSTDFLDGFAMPPYTLGNQGFLQPMLDFYNGTGTLNPNAFNNGSLATGGGWTAEDLLNQPTPPQCSGANPLQCELTLAKPVVMFVMFSPSNATAIPSGVFQSDLQSIVSTIMSSGTIPVLVTLPDDGSVSLATLAEYNEIIVNVANGAQIPLWNLYNTMSPIGAGQVYSVGNGNAADLSDPALQSGANRRNLAALNILKAIKDTYFP